MKKILYAVIVMLGVYGMSEGMEFQNKVQDTTTVPHLRLVLPISAEDSALSPRSMYDKGSTLILSGTKDDQEYGAWLILKSARNGCSDALSHFSLSCNIQKIETWSDLDLLQALLEIASRK